MRLPKLIKGQMNINFVTLKAGYAEGVKRPRRETKPKQTTPFNPIVIRRAF